MNADEAQTARNATGTRMLGAWKGQGVVELGNAGKLSFQFHSDGVLAAIRHRETLLNRIIVCPGDMPLLRIYFRLWREGHLTEAMLLNLGLFKAGERIAEWSGKTGAVNWRLQLELDAMESRWRWKISVENGGGDFLSCDVLFFQDLGLGDEGAVRTNEAYTSHYIDQTVISGPCGPIILSRQNQPQAGGRHPWIAHGCVTGGEGFATDGTQFFGLGVRGGGDPAALTAVRLPSTRMQGEFACAPLQSRLEALPSGGAAEFVFQATYLPDHREVSSERDLAALQEWSLSQAASPVRRWVASVSSLFQTARFLNGKAPGERLLHERFPGRHRQVESAPDGSTRAFFHGIANHVVTRSKEETVERSHGHILRSGRELWLDPRHVGTTVYAAGIFGSQLYVGNTNFTRLLSVVRCPNNLLRSSGQRIFVETPDGWKQLGIPSVFEMAPDFARWIYVLPDGRDTIEVTVWCPLSTHVSCLRLQLNGKPRRFLVSHQLAGGVNEMETAVDVSTNPEAGAVTIRPGVGSLSATHQADLRFDILAEGASDCEKIGDGRLLGTLPEAAPYAVCRTRPVTNFGLAIGPVWSAGDTKAVHDTWRLCLLSHPSGGSTRQTVAHWTGGLALRTANNNEVAAIAEVIPWFSHNAMIHLCAPHGLEQYGGAAWGVRDVCQGAVEWLLAQRRFAEVRRIVIQVFSQQYPEDPQWPQWFMHPPYGFIQQAHCHGDIPFWPVKALCDYIEASNDFAILDEKIAYTDAKTFQPLPLQETMREHTQRVVDHYRRRCLGNTALVNYGDGDWDDTLQPVDPKLRANMVSSWTVALSHHVFRQLAVVAARAGFKEWAAKLDELRDAIAADFRRHLMPDGVVCGFALWDGIAFQPLLHPRDRESGIAYRLLPMTRSILAGLFSREEADLHLALIREHLLFPDGARLMSAPVPYAGGVMRRFKRAESSAYFGREVSLQYVHAHLRYAEALAAVGDARGLFDALQVVNPVGLEQRLAQALPRQSNAYFSSSDGAFADRIAANANYLRIKSGEIPVKGGWRIYSSGPGLFLHKIVSSWLGLRDSFGDVVIDPVLPQGAGFSGVELDRPFNGKAVTWRFYPSPGVEEILVNGVPLGVSRNEKTPYRSGGWRFSAADFDRHLDAEINLVEIPIPRVGLSLVT